MAITPTYPGVYVQEIPSGVRTITGVATSITAFIGYALQGPVNDPIRIKNFGDFERQFGGLWTASTMSFAVQQFFLNGGSDALIVRLSNPGSKATVTLQAGGELTLESFAPGVAGNQLRVTVDHQDVSEDTNFNLTVNRISSESEGEIQQVFKLENIGFDELESRLKSNQAVRVAEGSTIASRPEETTDQSFSGGGQDGGKVAKLQLPVSDETEAGDESEQQYLTISAASEGEWGNSLEVAVDYDTAKPETTFNLVVQLVDNGNVINIETLRNLSMNEDDSRYIIEVVNAQSALINIENESSDLPAGRRRPDVTDFIKVAQANQGANGQPPADDGAYIGSKLQKTGLYSLEKADLFNLLCIPPVRSTVDISEATWTEALAYCAERRAMLLVDPPQDWTAKANVTRNLSDFLAPLGDNKKNAALFFPRIKFPNPLKENRLENFPPSAAVAGIFARTDSSRGVWKAPAGTEASINGARGLSVSLTDDENGDLNPLGVNCLRNFPVYGNVAWGSRTLDGDDRLASEWKYVPVRRLALFLQESLYRGTQWVVFEPNDEPLWAQIRLNVGAFMNNLFRQGAFQGTTPKDAYFVKCDSETTTQNDIDRGIVNILIGFAPLKPAEFVILKFQQIAGQLET